MEMAAERLKILHDDSYSLITFPYIRNSYLIGPLCRIIYIDYTTITVMETQFQELLSVPDPQSF